MTDAVKAAGDLELEVLGLPFGTDRQGQVFDAQTNVELQPGDEVPAYYYHGFAERAAKSVKRLGTAIYQGASEAGHVFRVKLDAAHEKARAVYDAAVGGIARASSDSSTHLVRPTGIVGKPGRVSSWPIFALSLMDGETSAAAVNPRAVAVAAAKALFEEIDLSDSGEVDASKAGKPFNKGNREKLLAMKATLDEMLAQIDSTDMPNNDSAQADNTAQVNIYDGKTAAKTEVTKMEENNIPVQAEAAKVDEIGALKAEFAKLNEAVLAAQRPAFNVNVGAKPDSDAAKAEEAAKAFERYYRFGDKNAMIAAKAAMNEGTAGEGGYLVPRGYSNEVVTALNEASILRAAGARTISIGGTNSFRVPKLVNSTTGALLTAEGVAYDEQEPTVGEQEFIPYKVTALSKVSEELLADSRVNVFGEFIQPDAVNRFTIRENSYFATGTGSGQPQGLFVGASVGVTASATNAITIDEVIDLYHSMATQYRSRAVWVMNDATLKVIRKYRENGTTGAFLWQPAISAGQPETILGRHVYTVSTAPTIATGNKVIAFGDLSYFWIADFGQLTFQRLDELYAATGQVGFRWGKRIDSHVMLSDAIKVLRLA